MKIDDKQISIVDPFNEEDWNETDISTMIYIHFATDQGITPKKHDKWKLYKYYDYNIILTDRLYSSLSNKSIYKTHISVDDRHNEKNILSIIQKQIRGDIQLLKDIKKSLMDKSFIKTLKSISNIFYNYDVLINPSTLEITIHKTNPITDIKSTIKRIRNGFLIKGKTNQSIIKLNFINRIFKIHKLKKKITSNYIERLSSISTEIDLLELIESKCNPAFIENYINNTDNKYNNFNGDRYRYINFDDFMTGQYNTRSHRAF